MSSGELGVFYLRGTFTVVVMVAVSVVGKTLRRSPIGHSDMVI